MKSKLLIFLLSFVFCSIFGSSLKLENEVIDEKQNTSIKTNTIVNSIENEEANVLLENLVITEEMEKENELKEDDKKEIIEETKVIKEEQKTVEEKSSKPVETYNPEKEEVIIEEKQEEIKPVIHDTKLEPEIIPEPEPESEPVQEEKHEEVIRCTNTNNHGMDVGNSGRWFSSKKEAIDYYDSKLEYWDKWVKEDPDNRWDEYLNKCPLRYEVWDCMFCGKWTINFYYR